MPYIFILNKVEYFLQRYLRCAFQSIFLCQKWLNFTEKSHICSLFAVSQQNVQTSTWRNFSVFDVISGNKHFSRSTLQHQYCTRSHRSVKRYLSSCNSINTFGFSTLYPTIFHSMLKDRLREFVQLLFIKQIANVDTNMLYSE